MKRKLVLRNFSIIISFLIILITGASYSQEMDGSNHSEKMDLMNKVKIVFPSNGASLGFRTIVKGTSELTDDSEIWILARPKFMPDQWWPQPKPTVDEKGNWEAMVYLGGPQDVGYDFEIAVATFSKEEATIIHEYHARGMSSGSWLPIRFPDVTSNIDIIEVKKIKHYQ